MTRIDPYKHIDSDFHEKGCRLHCTEPINENSEELVRKSTFFNLDCLVDAGFHLGRFLRNAIASYDRIIKVEEHHLKSSTIRGKMPRRKSIVDKIKQESPEVEKMGYRLRPKRATTVPSKFFDISSDEDMIYVKTKRELRCRKSKLRESDTWDSGRPKRACNKQKKILDEDSLDLDTSKTRNSSEDCHDCRVQKKSSKKVLTTKKPRNTQLSRLNNEAEHFLFPHKDDSSSDEEIGRRRKVLTKRKHNKLNDRIRAVKSELLDEASMGSSCSETSINRKKRRRTQAEAFIMDNEKYYKFEMPGSRLRYQGSYLAPLPSKNSNESDTKRFKKECRSGTEEKSVQDRLTEKRLKPGEEKFSFEIVPRYEPWYETFQRQDQGKDVYFSSDPELDDSKLFLLPSEVAPLPPLDPAICISLYNEYKQELLEDSSGSAPCSTPDAGSSLDGKGTDSIDEDSKSSEDKKCDDSNELKSIYKKKGGKKKSAVSASSSKNPRKSPRQHASTLAILSSLINHRKRGRTSDPSKRKLPTIPEEKELEQDYELVLKDIDQFLGGVEDSELDVESEDCDINLKCQSDIIDAMEEYDKVKVRKTRESILVIKSPRTSGVKKRYVKKKKKKNRTGWPNKNLRRILKKDEQGNSELDDSNVDSPVYGGDNVDVVKESTCGDDVSKLDGVRRTSRNGCETVDEVITKINGDVPDSKVNGMKDNCEKAARVVVPRRKEHRGSSSDCAEVVVACAVDKVDCVNVDLDKWESAEKAFAAKLRNDSINSDLHFQPIVRVEKLDSDIEEKHTAKKTRVSPILRRTNRPRRMPASPKSPRMLRRPRGGWYREFY